MSGLAVRVWHSRIAVICFFALPVLRLLLSARGKHRTRSLWAGAPILTLPLKARAERALGVDARTLVFGTYFISKDFDYNLERWTRSRWRRTLLHPWLFLWACWKFDRFHFYCDAGLLPSPAPREFNPRELRYYRYLGKEVFFWTYGADVRTQDRTRALGEFNCCLQCPEPGKFCICGDARGAKNQETLARYATGRFSMGDMIEYTPGSRNDLFFWPLDLAADGGARYAPAVPSESARGPVRIVHAANHREFKGTRFLVDAVERLKAKGIAVELVLVEGLPNEEALEIYRSADIVFDQCLIGFHGYFAIEAMAIGKPVVVYIRKPEYLLERDQCPLVNASPANLEAELEALIADRARLHELGLRGRQYVERFYSIDAFSRRLASALPPS